MDWSQLQCSAVSKRASPSTDAAPADPRGVVADGSLGLSARDSTSVIHDSVREAILSGELGAGTAVSQAKIAEQFGTSRGPVREALRLLEREGLVEAQVNQRPRVAGLSIEDLEELYALRIIVESLAITVSVPRFDGSDLTHLHELLDGMAATGEGRDTRRYDALHHRFHRELGKYAGARIVSDADRLYDHATRYRQIYREQTPRAWSVAAQEHRDIVTACETGDAREAGVLLSRHYARTALTVLAMIRPEHEPVLVRVALQRVVGSVQNGGPTPTS